MNKILKIYKILLKEHDYQGWWPLNSEYHPKDYTYPKNNQQEFEIIAGAILTQSTSWKNVEMTIKNLKINKIISPSSIINLPKKELAKIIKSSGYHNQKARKLKEFTNFYLNKKEITREALLNVWGIGPETADSILLYAYKKPYFVIDTYTKRILSRLGLCKENDSYKQIQKIFHDNLKKDYKLFNEYHALLVKHAKECCRAKGSNLNCPLKKLNLSKSTLQKSA